MLNFWAAWCPPCKKETPEYGKYSMQAGEDVVILAVTFIQKMMCRHLSMIWDNIYHSIGQSKR